MSRVVTSLSASWFLSRALGVAEDGEADEDRQGDVAVDMNDLLINGEVTKSQSFKNPPRTWKKPKPKATNI